MKSALWTLAFLAFVSAAAAQTPADDAWRRAEMRDDPAAYQAYLNAHPTGPEAAAARRRLQEARDADRLAWDRARAQNTPRAYEAYRAANPTGAWRAEAGARADGLLRPAPPTYFPPPAPPRR